MELLEELTVEENIAIAREGIAGRGSAWRHLVVGDTTGARSATTSRRPSPSAR